MGRAADSEDKKVAATSKGGGKLLLREEMEELAEQINRRKTALEKWASKFEKFHLHFDGEILIRSKKGKEYFELQGAHNYLVNGEKVVIGKIRKPPGVKLDDIPNDVPFIANVEMKYANRYLPKQATSSFFPKNWDITRVKEEVALVYDDVVKSGKDFSKPPFKFIRSNSEGTFDILVEVDRLGNIVNAFPNIKI